MVMTIRSTVLTLAMLSTGNAAAPTRLLACFLMAGGVFKVVTAVAYRFAAWGWSLAGGIIDVISSG
jgi:uncharacterized membrane protein HdeD (DUF308 family)